MRPVREHANIGIRLTDGTRLAARIWLPVDAEAEPVPAILEYVPYRQADATAERDAVRHAWFAARGYAGVRVDLRGSGDSDGILRDEYLRQEQEDALEVLSWLAAQPWCNGKVGMIGISWGGFVALQVAALRPPELGAIVAVCASDDRYADDVHYAGGCVLATDMLHWATTMLAWNARPPNPVTAGRRWRELWRERLDETVPWVHEWLAHQRRDAYWQQGSVCEDYGRIACPVFAVGGWADGYRTAVLRLLDGLSCPRKGLVGPWSHMYPDEGVPGPAIGFLQECLRWWDQCLKGRDTGVMEEPMLRVWMQDSVPPHTFYAERPGRWVAETSWPSANVAEVQWFLNPSGLQRSPEAPVALVHSASQLTGVDAAAWCPEGQPGDWPADQRAEDGRSLAFTSAPLAEPVEILGCPVAQLQLAADRPIALVAVRLCDIAPSGESTLVTRGVLNLTHRDGHGAPAPLEPGRTYDVAVGLQAIAHRFTAGHRLRVAVSSAYWPWAWPPPEPVTLTLHAGLSRIVLPLRRSTIGEDAPWQFESPEHAAALEVVELGPPQGSRTVRWDPVTGESEIVFEWDLGPPRRLQAAGIELGERSRAVYQIRAEDPLSAAVRCDAVSELVHGPWRTRVEAESDLTCDAKTFRVGSRLRAFEGAELVWEREWRLDVPRDLA